MNQEKIGKLIAEERKKKKLTQEELARRIKVSRSTLSKWECGIQIPDVELLLELSKQLEITINELLIGEKKPQPVETNLVTTNLLKYSLKSWKNKKLKITIFFTSIILCLLLIFGVCYFNYKRNKIEQFEISTSENDIYIKGYILANYEKQYIILDKIEYNSTYTGTVDEIYTQKIRLSLISDNDVIYSYEKETSEPKTLSSLLEDTSMLVNSENVESLNIKNLFLKVEYVTEKGNNDFIIVEIST